MSKDRARVVALDGPAASGKSVVGLRLAQRLGDRFVDSGTMYRAVTLLALERGVTLDDDEALTRIAASASIKIGETDPATGQPRLLVDGRDVSHAIRSPEVDRAVLHVAKVAGVRDALVRLQRELAAEGRVVMVGRDIGTVVVPDAELKVFLEASAEERAQRRLKDMQARGEPIDYARVLEDLRRRDKLDSERAIAPLVPARDAVRFMTDGYTIDQVVDQLWHLTAKR